MDVSRLTWRRDGLEAMARTAEMSAAMQRAGAVIAGRCRARVEATNLAAGRRAPVRVDGSGTDSGGVFARVVTSDPGWHFAEYGTWEMPPSAPMRGGAEDAGARFVDRGPS